MAPPKLGLARCLLFAAAVAAGSLQALGPSALEYEIKAVFLYNIAKYVEWPAGSSLADGKQPIVLAVLGRDPFGTALEEAVRDRTAQGRTLAIRRYSSVEQVQQCHIVFISSSEAQHAAQIMNLLARTGALTVTDSQTSAHLGGIIQFSMEASKVRFDIDLGAAHRSGLRLSSQLLRLARTVKGAGT